MKIYTFRILFISVLMVLQACVGVQTFPGAARSGDTITLALGALEGVNKNNITLTFTSDTDGLAVDLTPGLRSVFNLYPDKTSMVNIQSTDAAQVGTTARADALTTASAHSVWLSVAVVDLLQGLAVGSGKISVIFDPVIRPLNDAISAESTSINLEILPETGSPETLFFIG